MSGMQGLSAQQGSQSSPQLQPDSLSPVLSQGAQTTPVSVAGRPVSGALPEPWALLLQLNQCLELVPLPPCSGVWQEIMAYPQAPPQHPNMLCVLRAQGSGPTL